MTTMTILFHVNLSKGLQSPVSFGHSLQANPMMGLRGCRLGVVHPEITEMQVGCAFHFTSLG